MATEAAQRHGHMDKTYTSRLVMTALRRALFRSAIAAAISAGGISELRFLQ